MEQSKLPMIELHLHLDGAIPPETMWVTAAGEICQTSFKK